MAKKTAVVFHCGSFDHHGLQSQSFILRLQNQMFGACDTQLERYFHDLHNDTLQDPKYLKYQLVRQEIFFLQLFSDCRA